MPYIKKEAREKFLYKPPFGLDQHVCEGAPPLDMLSQIGDFVENEGELNYVITVICKTYLKKHGLAYHNIARITGVLENVKQEFYRRVAVEYENGKIAENGDVL